MSQKVIIASKNPVKINAAKMGFQKIFPNSPFEFGGVSVPSGVSDQPETDGETLQGAKNRAENAKAKNPDADIWIGIEGGIEKIGNEMSAFAWVVILSDKIEGKAKTGTFFLPRKVVELINKGKELGEADDIVFGKSNSKQEGGAVGLLTGNISNRTQLYTEAVILALIPFKNPELF